MHAEGVSVQIVLVVILHTLTNRTSLINLSKKIVHHLLARWIVAFYSHFMKKVGVIINPKRAQAKDTIQQLADAAGRYDWQLFCEQSDIANELGCVALDVEAFVDEVELVLAMGGDGTVLYAARALLGSSVPVLGINLGRLGFLTAVAEEELVKALDQVAGGGFELLEREAAMTKLKKVDGTTVERPALNDVVMSWGGSSRIVQLGLKVDEEQVGQFSCDGIIISTPTGSTGHALSNGGPILHPAIHGFGISVICPHTLSSRPMVVPNRSRIEVEVVRCHKALLLSVDGQDCATVEEGDRLELVRYPQPLQMVQLPGHSYFQTLAQKLGWQGSVV